MPIIFDFNELRGRIVARFGNYTNFAQKINLSPAQLSERLKNKRRFKPEEIYDMCAPDVLDIPDTEIGKYFFKLKV